MESSHWLNQFVFSVLLMATSFSSFFVILLLLVSCNFVFGVSFNDLSVPYLLLPSNTMAYYIFISFCIACFISDSRFPTCFFEF